MTKEKAKSKQEKENDSCADVKSPRCGNLKTHGRIFEGAVIRKFPKRVTIEFERMIYVRKYERYAKSRTRIHARLPECMEKDINVGDIVKVQGCRPLSKIIHFVVLGKVNGKEKVMEREK